MERDGVEAPRRVGDRCAAGIGAGGGGLEPGRGLQDFVPVAHPHLLSGRQVLEQPPGPRHANLSRSKLTLWRANHPAAELMGHELHAVADAQNRHPEPVDGRIEPRRPGAVHGIGAARQDQTPCAAQPVDRRVERHELAVHVELPHTTGDQLGVLRPEVQDDDGFAGPGPLPAGLLRTAHARLPARRPTPCTRRSTAFAGSFAPCPFSSRSIFRHRRSASRRSSTLAPPISRAKRSMRPRSIP